MRNKKLFILALTAFLLHGCATMISESMQSVTLTVSNGQGDPVEGVECVLKNDRGSWEAESSSHIQIRRSAGDLLVECERAGMASGSLRAISRASGGMWANLLVAGGVGALVDERKGTGYNYPSDLPVVMGKSVVVDRRHEDERNARAEDSGF